MRVHNPYIAPRDGARLGVLLRSAFFSLASFARSRRFCRARLEDRAKHRLGEFAGGCVLLARMVGTDQQWLALAGAMLRIVSEYECGSPRILPDPAGFPDKRRKPAGPVPQPLRTFFSSSSSRSRYGRQVRISSTVGLLSGGAQRTAALMYASVSFSPSSRETLVGCEAKPVANKTLYRKSPELSPVNIRPVRLAPWAPGASPIRSSRALGIAKAGHWLRPIIPIAIGAAFDASHFGAICHQARALFTRDNLGFRISSAFNLKLQQRR